MVVRAGCSDGVLEVSTRTDPKRLAGGKGNTSKRRVCIELPFTFHVRRRPACVVVTSVSTIFRFFLVGERFFL